MKLRLKSLPYRVCMLSLAISTAMTSGSAIAQVDNQSESDNHPTERKIVVTAQHREENPQDVPIAISLFQSDELAKMAAESINDLGDMTPGIETNNTSVTQPSYNIRGIKTNDFGIGSDPAVAVYVDGVYVGRGGASQANFNDIDRVEILKGPQGTLFGRNAAAGAIHIITNKAEREDSGQFGLTFGQHGRAKVSGMYNHELSEDLFFRTSFVTNKRDGYQSVVAGWDDLGEQDSQSIKASLLWEYSPTTEVVFRLDYDTISQDGGIDGSIVAALAPAEPFGAVDVDVRSLEERDLWGASVEIISDYSDYAMTYIASYRAFDSSNLQDDDGTANSRFFFATRNVEEQAQASQEIRFSSTTDSDFQWTVGANYSWENAEQEHQVLANTNTLDTFFLIDSGLSAEMINGLPPGLGMGGFFDAQFSNEIAQLAALTGLTPTQVNNMIVTENLNRPWDETTRDDGTFTSIAMYADTTYAVNEQFDVTFGLRYTHDSKEFEVASRWDNAFSIPFPGVDPVPFGLVFFDQFDPAVAQEDSWDAWTPRLVLDYKWNDNLMTYFSSAKGYKSGGFNSLGVDPAFNSEQVLNNELGIKSSWLDNNLILNVSIYDYVYDDLQILKLSGPAGAIPTYNVGNADAEGSGFDLEFRWQMSDDFLLAANYSHVETEYTSYSLFPGETAADDLTGEALSSIPENKWNMVAEYNLNLSELGNVAFRVHYNFTDDRTNHTDADLSRVIDSYSLLNARVSYFPNDANWDISLWANNLTDEEYLLGLGGQGSAIGTPTSRRALPKMVGVDFNMYF